VLIDLSLDTAPEVLSPYWEEDLQTAPAEIAPLQPEVFLALREYVRLDPAVDGQLSAVASEVRGNPALRALWWHCYQLLFHHPDYSGDLMGRWPDLSKLLGQEQGVFYLLIALGAVTEARGHHEARGIPDEITRGIYGNFEELVGNYQTLNPGRWGVDLRIVSWLRYPACGMLYRLGRIEYMNRPYHGQALAYRHHTTGETVALAADGVNYTSAGYIANTPGEGNWTSRLEVAADCVRGHYLDPRGHATRKVLELSRDEWECALRPGDHVLEMHIPPGGGFQPEVCRASLQQAVEFFPRYFPERSFVGLGCQSWILNPQMHEVYRPDNNMTLWQQEMYLYPVPSSGRDGLFFVFAEDQVDLATAPRDTSLRRAVLDWLAAGHRLMSGGAFVLTGDLARYGTQPYRHQPGVAQLVE
jgi:hypothetical protein